jgi:hypothetical protein
VLLSGEVRGYPHNRGDCASQSVEAGPGDVGVWREDQLVARRAGIASEMTSWPPTSSTPMKA